MPSLHRVQDAGGKQCLILRSHLSFQYLNVNVLLQGDYKTLPGMFPHAAGKIASHGPYEKVSDIYKIPDLTDNDRKLFKKYEKFFAVNPPGRAFDERINARVST